MVTGASLELRVGDQTENTEAEKVDREVPRGISAYC